MRGLFFGWPQLITPKTVGQKRAFPKSQNRAHKQEVKQVLNEIMKVFN